MLQPELVIAVAGRACISDYRGGNQRKHRAGEQKEISNKDTLLLDFSQIRGYPYTQITWFSYLDVLMIKAVGEDVCPKTDIINEHRAEFIICLKEKTEALRTNKIQNQKR